MKGFFITFEGPDGSGKTTQIKMLGEFLEKMGLKVLITREPGGTKVGQKIRDILLSKNYGSMDYKTETLLFLASRAELTSKVIEPAIKSEKIVISDRFFDSTVVYQGIARNLGEKEILKMSLWSCKNLIPDITFLLIVGVREVEERIKNINKEKDRIELEEDNFKQKIYSGYLKVANDNKDRFVILDGKGDINHIFNKIKHEVIKKLKEKKIL